MNMREWLQRQLGPKDRPPLGTVPGEPVRLPLAWSDPGWLRRVLGFGRSAAPSWTEDGWTLRAYRRDRTRVRRASAASACRNRGTHPKSGRSTV
jgi:hypothetical protein